MKKLIALVTILSPLYLWALGPSVVEDFSIVETGSTSVVLSWSESVDAVKYMIYFDKIENIDASNPQYINQIEIDSPRTQEVIEWITPNTWYTFVIVGIDSDRRESEELSKPLTLTTLESLSPLSIRNTETRDTSLIITTNYILKEESLQVTGDNEITPTILLDGKTLSVTLTSDAPSDEYIVAWTLTDVFWQEVSLPENTTIQIVAPEPIEEVVIEENNTEILPVTTSESEKDLNYTEPVPIDELPRTWLTEILIIVIALTLGLIIERSVSRRFLNEHTK